MQLDLSTSQGASCLVLGAALNGCAQGDQLVGSILSAFDAPFTLSSLRADLTAALGTLGNGSLLNATVALALPELLAAVEGARALTGNASAASLGNSSDPAAVQAALDEAEAVAAAVGAQADDPDSPLSALRRCMVSLATVTIDALRAAGDTVLFALDALDANDVCTFFVVLWEGLLGNLDELTALFSLLGSVGFLGCGFLYFFYVPSAIAMQVPRAQAGGRGGGPMCACAHCPLLPSGRWARVRLAASQAVHADAGRIAAAVAMSHRATASLRPSRWATRARPIPPTRRTATRNSTTPRLIAASSPSSGGGGARVLSFIEFSGSRSWPAGNVSRQAPPTGRTCQRPSTCVLAMHAGCTSAPTTPGEALLGAAHAGSSGRRSGGSPGCRALVRHRSGWQLEDDSTLEPQRALPAVLAHVKRLSVCRAL